MRLVLQLASLLLRGTALMLGLTGTALAAAALGGAFSDRLDALTHFTPLYLALGLGGVGLGLAGARGGERRVIVGLGLACVLACGLLMGPELLAAAGPKAKPSAQDLTLVQFNVWAQNHDPDASLAWILAQKADLVLIEEGGGEAWPIIRALRKTYPYAVSCAGKGSCDTWIFSRRRMVARRGLYTQDQPFSGAWATLADPRGDFTVVAAHYVWPIPAGPQQAQSRYLASVLAPFDHAGLIVGGDFNSTPWSFSLRRQDRAFGLQRRTRALASWPSGAFSRLAKAPFPLLPIDHVYAGKAWKTVSVTRGPALGSDHRPVVVRLRRQP